MKKAAIDGDYDIMLIMLYDKRQQGIVHTI